ALQPWPQLGEGVAGLYLHFADYQITDGRIVEIPIGGETISQRHLYEKGIYILCGSGYTILQQEGKPIQRVEWKQGDLFSVPLNVLHQHYATGDAPARMLMVTSFPLVLNVMNNEDFIDNNPSTFTDRYDGSPDYLQRTEQLGEFKATANFVEDIRSTGTRRMDYRGKGNETMGWLMAGNSMLDMHISQMPPRMYKKAHRHSSDAFILLLSGEGFSVAWQEGAYDERLRVDWKAGTLFVPPMYWYHQHLNSGSAPARYLAINVPHLVTNLGLSLLDQLEVDIPEVRSEWERQLEKVPTEL
ncbi:MAG: cupin domain-containing protein, partial [Lysobacterales bacterium]